jgi:hypothetical protein
MGAWPAWCYWLLLAGPRKAGRIRKCRLQMELVVLASLRNHIVMIYHFGCEFEPSDAVESQRDAHARVSGRLPLSAIAISVGHIFSCLPSSLYLFPLCQVLLLTPLYPLS